MTAPTGTLPRKNYSRFGLAAVVGIRDLSDRTGMVKRTRSQTHKQDSQSA
jgi:hypothetical protein